MTHTTFISIALYGSLTLKTVYILKLSSSSQVNVICVLWCWYELQNSSARGCVYVCTSAWYVPRVLLCWATDANSFGWWRSAGRRWFNPSNMLCSTNCTMRDNNALALLKLVCISVRNSACTMPTNVFSVIFRWKFEFIQRYSISFNNTFKCCLLRL